MTDTAPRARYLNAFSILGAVLTSASAVVFLIFFFLDLVGFHANPYLGILTFLVLPAVFVSGLLLIPAGIWRERRRVAAVAGSTTLTWPTIDLGRARVRRIAFTFAVLTCVNFVILALASFKAVEYADSREFCTATCHTPMEPETIANRSGIHASLACADCHIGPGAPGFVRAKWSGVHRLSAVLTNSHARPVPTPVHNLPAADGTCSQCHSRSAFKGQIVKQLRTYADDEGSTETVTTLTMNVGGGTGNGTPHIHWHASATTRLEYIAIDEKRATIPWVRVTDAKGVREYMTDGVTPEQLARGDRRIMDCTDCHNRQGHRMAFSAPAAVDQAITEGLLPQSLPFVRREVVAAVQDDTRDIGRAEKEIADRLTAFYAEQSPQLSGDARVPQAIAAAQNLYRRNVFPAMKVRWGTYPSQLGHTDAPGCFRCHDDTHKTKTGLVISQDCERCHRLES